MLATCSRMQTASEAQVLLTDAEVVVEDSRIVAVGPRGSELVDEVIELGDAVLMPGLVDLDALTDIDHTILDSWQSRELGLGLQWSRDYATHRRRAVFDAEERAFIREYGFVQLLLHGVTTAMPIASEVHSDWAETFADAVAMAESARRLGLRVYLGPAYRSGVNVVDADGSRSIYWNDDSDSTDSRARRGSWSGPRRRTPISSTRPCCPAGSRRCPRICCTEPRRWPRRPACWSACTPCKGCTSERS